MKSDFLAKPYEELLDSFTKDQSLNVASSNDTEITRSDRRLKESIKEALKAILIEKGGVPGKTDEGTPGKTSAVTTPSLSQPPSTEINLRFRELQLIERPLRLEEKHLKLELRQQAVSSPDSTFFT